MRAPGPADDTMEASLPHVYDVDVWHSFLDDRSDHKIGILRLAGAEDFRGLHQEIMVAISDRARRRKGIQSSMDDIIAAVTGELIYPYNFATVSETPEILYYQNDIFVTSEENIIEKQAEARFGYDLSNYLISEVAGHIRRKIYRTKNEFDVDMNIVNVRNGLFTIF
jgi:hypothetical protein